MFAKEFYVLSTHFQQCTFQTMYSVCLVIEADSGSTLPSNQS